MRLLGIRASYVGNDNDGAPSRGSSDEVVLDHARKTNQVVVTINHDMIILCAEANESVVWIDPRGRQFRRTELVPLVFNRVEAWERMFADAGEPVCVHVLRTKTDVISLERAKHLVLQRMRRLAARKRAQVKRREQGGSLFE